MLAQLAAQVRAGEELTRDAMRDAVGVMMQGAAPAEEVKALLLALHERGESIAEIAGAAEAMRAHMVRVPTRRTGIVDTCGTGGTGSKTFNISTAAAIVVAAAGVPVAKHGNRSVTSLTGSADVLEVLGVNLQAPVQTIGRCLDELGICFCFATQFHPAMKHVGPIRKQLGVQTIFNLLGPLCNPAGAEHQLLGVGRPELRPKIAAALALLGTKRSVIVGSDDGLGELSTAAPTRAIEVADGQLREFTWNPADFGLPTAAIAELAVASPQASAAIIRQVFSGQPGPHRTAVVLNAAAALWVATPGATPAACAQRAAVAIDSGAASELLERLAEMSHQA